jgi:AcrR family transcriptional regulator
MSTSSSPHSARISSAALHLAAAEGWQTVTLGAVAKRAKMPLATVKKYAASRATLICLIAAELDRSAFAAVGKLQGGPRDVLFDLLMARFDAMQKHRKAILSMVESTNGRERGCGLARATLEGAYRLVDAARLKKPMRPVLVSGVVAVYGWAFYAWRKDASRDMAKTMAAVDRGLRVAEKAIKLLP